MKLKFLLVLVCAVFISSFKKSSNERIIGTWRMCTLSSYGMVAHPNHCPTIIFYKNGTGACEDEEPWPRFNWRVERDSIFFSFEPEDDKKRFIFSESKFNFEFYTDGKIEHFKLSNKNNARWHMLSRELNK